ncbi:MAG TPA: chromate efflux transporter, partial [Steroidobacteraceae bacterium]|nr:chromate efflux transporter [Steroidobacteraceae bacterium]
MLRVALQLGLTSCGGPIAHLGYFERTYVRQRGWLSEQHYGALVALCQILPGPTSSQVGFLIGLHRAGWPGALAAWFGFTLPSALLMYAGAVLSARPAGPLALAVVHGLKLVAVAVVAQAVWTMARRLCTDIATWLIGVSAAVLLLLVGGSAAQLGVLAGAAVAGTVWCRPTAAAGAAHSAVAVPGTAAWPALGVFLLLLVGLPLLAWRSPHGELALAEVFYRSGALVFGGGHVVLPLLRESLVPHGWLSDDRFLA